MKRQWKQEEIEERKKLRIIQMFKDCSIGPRLLVHSSQKESLMGISTLLFSKQANG